MGLGLALKAAADKRGVGVAPRYLDAVLQLFSPRHARATTPDNEDGCAASAT